ncbi:MAG: cell division protein ZapD [Gammaproteobacteria bacterium]|nr:cell division protein ZapD [Gammaproteobacteria bacterium]MDH5730787.1 cell division protein ZapD [Gammaproteobacteria bacterium]
MLVVGLTGGIGCGKSAVASRFEALGVPVIDADQIARELAQPGQAAFERIIDVFGDDILNENGEINRAQLRQIVFNNPQAKEKLEAILHPLVREEMQNQVEAIEAAYCILMIPLLMETGQNQMVDRILVVDCDEALQIERTINRDGVSEEDVRAIINSQISREERLSRANEVIENLGDLVQLYTKVDALDGRYRDIVSTAKQVKTMMNSNNNSAKKWPANGNSGNAQVNTTAAPWLQDQATTLELVSSNAEPTELIYELPLNERLRTLLRLEGLFIEIQHHLSGDSVWSSRSAIKVLIAILNTLNRPDIKTDFIREMDRLYNTLEKFAKVTGVDTDRLNKVQAELKGTIQHLRAMNGQFGQQLRQNELVAAIKQRETIPGGPSTFDIPVYGYWLNQSIERRRADLRAWLSEFELLEQSVKLVLRIVRESAVPRKEEAVNGTFQLILDNTVSYQMIRVVLPLSSPYAAEISGGRHRFGIRFVELQEAEKRPLQTKDDVNFYLSCCAI